MTLTTTPMKSINEALRWRYATQKFDMNKKLTDEEINNLLDSARLSPSWFGLQPWKFILVEDAALREKLQAVSYNQEKVTKSSHFVVFVSKTDYTEKDVDEYLASTAKAQGKTPADLKDLKGAIMNGFIANHKDHLAKWASNQTHISFGVFLAAAAAEGIDAGPMGGFDPSAYDEILGLKELGLHAEVICALGHRSEDDEDAKRPKSRFSLEEVVIRR